MPTWLLVDGNYMARRALYTTGGLRHQGVGTGVAFGFLRDVTGLIDLFDATRTVLAFDSRDSLRKQVYPGYKASRADKTDAEREMDKEFYEELYRLKSDLLPMMGFRNIVECDGYEADDVIAAVSVALPGGVDAVVVSADTDLFQCISGQVVFYNPTQKKVINVDSFRAEWGLMPSDWPRVKALAGCSTDDIKGVAGVGEKTAAMYYSGRLSKGKKYDAIKGGEGVVHRNLPLVKLPFPGMQLPILVDDELTPVRQLEVELLLGIRDRRGAAARSGDGGFDL